MVEECEIFLIIQSFAFLMLSFVPFNVDSNISSSLESDSLNVLGDCKDVEFSCGIDGGD